MRIAPLLRLAPSNVHAELPRPAARAQKANSCLREPGGSASEIQEPLARSLDGRAIPDHLGDLALPLAPADEHRAHEPVFPEKEPPVRLGFPVDAADGLQVGSR